MGFAARFVFDGLVFRDIGAAYGVFFHLFQGEARMRFRPFSFDSKHRCPFPQYSVQDIANGKQQEKTYDERHVSAVSLSARIGYPIVLMVPRISREMTCFWISLVPS